MSQAARVRRPPNLPAELRPTMDAIDQALAANRVAIQNGILTEEYEWTGAAVARVQHGLRRAIRGWYPVRIRARTFVVFYEDLATDLGAMADTHIAIACNDACIVQFWVW